MENKVKPQPGNLMGQGLIMKVLTGWKIIQLFPEFGKVTFLRHKRQLVAQSIINMFICIWHGAKIRRISVKYCFYH